MKPLAPLIFPDTVIRPDHALAMLSFFARLHHYLPVPPEGESRTPFTERNLVEGYAPADLGEDLPRFKLLLKDLHGHENEYLGGWLSALSGFTGDPDEAAVWSLFRKLSRGQGDEPETARSRETLWQALLLLKLAETLSREEEMVAAGLAAAEESHARLLAELRGEEDEEEELFSPEELAVTPPGELTLDFARLTRAWAQLFARDRKRDGVWLLATPRREAALLVLDRYESLSGTAPRNLLSIPLPSVEAESPEAGWAEIETLKIRAAGSLERFATLLWQTATAGDNEALEAAAASLAGAAAVWEKELFPAGRQPTRHQTLNFYLLKDFSLPRIFATLAVPLPETAAWPEPVARHGLLAVLENGQP